MQNDGAPVPGRDWRNKVAIYAICFINLSYLLPSVAIADIAASFPATPRETVMLVVSLPCLTSVAGSLSLPLLQSRLSLKRIALLALTLSVLTGFAPLLFTGSIAAILLFAALQGISYGVFVSIYPLLNAARFAGEARASVMGVCTAMIQLGRLSILFFGGLLADIHWSAVYYLFGMVLVALVLVAVFLTDLGPMPRRTAGAGRAGLGRLFKSAPFWYMAVTGAVYLILYYNVATYASIYVQENALGTPSTTGTVSAAASAVAVFTALLSSRVRRVTKRYTSAAAFIGLGLGLFLPGAWISVAAIWLGMTLSSIAKSQQMPYLMGQISDIPDEGLRVSAMAIVQTLIGLGYFISPAVTTFLGNTFGSGSAGSVYAASGGAAAVIGVAMVAIEACFGKKMTLERLN